MNDSDRAKVRRLAKSIGELSDFMNNDSPEELVAKGLAMLEVAQGRKITPTDEDMLDIVERFKI